MSIIVNSFGVLLIVGIVWWFWLYRPHGQIKMKKGTPIDVVVEDGVYQPAIISAPLSESITLRFMRKDSNPCSKTLLFEDFGISEELPLNKHKDIVITPKKVGIYEFTCQMKMYRGTLEISDNSNGAQE